MEDVKLLPQPQILAEWWLEVKENFWQDDIKKQVKQLVKDLMESSMIQELIQKTGVGYYKHSPERQDYRNGYYERSLITQFGIIQGIISQTCPQDKGDGSIFDTNKTTESIKY